MKASHQKWEFYIDKMRDLVFFLSFFLFLLFFLSFLSFFSFFLFLLFFLSLFFFFLSSSFLSFFFFFLSFLFFFLSFFSFSFFLFSFFLSFFLLSFFLSLNKWNWLRLQCLRSVHQMQIIFHTKSIQTRSKIIPFAMGVFFFLLFKLFFKIKVKLFFFIGVAPSCRFALRLLSTDKIEETMNVKESLCTPSAFSSYPSGQ